MRRVTRPYEGRRARNERRRGNRRYERWAHRRRRNGTAIPKKVREETPEQQSGEDDDDHERDDRKSSAFVLLFVTAAAARRVAHVGILSTRRRQAAPRETQKHDSVIRVRIPLDTGAVARGAEVFAAATPLRVRELLALAVREAIGELAPADKLFRSVQRTVSGLRAGEYTLHIDGRVFADPDAVVVCDRTADLRFFVRDRTPKAVA